MGNNLENKAKVIEFEGIDGAGKATQVSLLKEFLKSKNKKVAVFEFPRHEQPVYGKLVDQYLNGDFGNPIILNPYFSSLIFSADRFEAKDELIKTLKKVDFLLLDRYAASNWAHQAVKFKNKKAKQKFIAWAKDLEFNKMGLPAPDKVLFLKIPFTGLLERIKQKNNRSYIKGRLDKHERDVKYLKSVQKEYLNIAKEKKRWQIIECSKNNQILPPQVIFKKILKALNLK